MKGRVLEKHCAVNVSGVETWSDHEQGAELAVQPICISTGGSKLGLSHLDVVVALVAPDPGRDVFIQPALNARSTHRARETDQPSTAFLVDGVAAFPRPDDSFSAVVSDVFLANWTYSICLRLVRSFERGIFKLIFSRRHIRFGYQKRCPDQNPFDFSVYFRCVEWIGPQRKKFGDGALFFSRPVRDQHLLGGAEAYPRGRTFALRGGALGGGEQMGAFSRSERRLPWRRLHHGVSVEYIIACSSRIPPGAKLSFLYNPLGSSTGGRGVTPRLVGPATIPRPTSSAPLKTCVYGVGGAGNVMNVISLLVWRRAAVGIRFSFFSLLIARKGSARDGSLQVPFPFSSPSEASGKMNRCSFFAPSFFYPISLSSLKSSSLLSATDSLLIAAIFCWYTGRISAMSGRCDRYRGFIA